MNAAAWYAFFVGLIAAGVARGTPILFATMGEVIAERSGVMNLGVEGMMLVGAMTGYGVADATGSAWLGLAAAIAASAALSLVHAVAVVVLRADQVVSGLAITFLGTGVSAVLGAPLVDSKAAAARLPSASIPLLREIPLIGPVVFDQNIVVVMGFLLVPLTWFYLNRTRAGMELRAIGEQPAAADSVGIRVQALRTAYVAVGGMLAGVAGASLSLAVTPGWVEGMTAGQGWIAVGLVIFAGWDPVRAAMGAWLFGTIRRLPLDLQGVPDLPLFRNPNLGYFLNMLPYLFTIAVLIVGSRESFRRRLGAPAALGSPFVRGRR